MSYPTLIAPLHFQYKTAFDILKTYFPLKNDDELSTMVLDFKSNKDSHVKHTKIPKKKNDSSLETTLDSTLDSTKTDSTKTDSTQSDSTLDSTKTDSTQNNDSISKIKKKSKKI